MATKKVDRALHGPSWTEVILGAVLSIILGVVLGAALLVFTVVEVVIQPLIIQMSLKHARALSGSSALLASFVALVITVWLTDGLRIDGATTWLLATVIVWLATLPDDGPTGGFFEDRKKIDW